MLRYCTHSYDVRSCYNNGKIPHLSSLICFRKITTVGHALRRQQALSFLLTNPETRKGRLHTLEKELASYIPVPQSDWDLLAQDRDSWRKMAVQKAYESEEAIYLQLNKSRAKGWEDIDRLQSRTFLSILEETLHLHFDSRNTDSYLLKPFCNPQHQNAFSSTTA